MKHIFFTLLFLLTISVHAQLNSKANLLKEELPEQYEEIKILAASDWEGDHEMMIHVINKQANSFINVLKLRNESNYDEAILGKALVNWTEEIKSKKIVDWVMVEYIYKKQLKAKGKY